MYLVIYIIYIQRLSHNIYCQAAEWTTAVIRDQVRDHDVATPPLLCHKEPTPVIGPCSVHGSRLSRMP